MESAITNKELKEIEAKIEFFLTTVRTMNMTFSRAGEIVKRCNDIKGLLLEIDTRMPI